MSKLFTLEEIKSQNGKNGAKTWIVLHDNVYDVTDYLQDVIPFFLHSRHHENFETNLSNFIIRNFSIQVVEN